MKLKTTLKIPICYGGYQKKNEECTLCRFKQQCKWDHEKNKTDKLLILRKKPTVKAQPEVVRKPPERPTCICNKKMKSLYILEGVPSKIKRVGWICITCRKTFLIEWDTP